MSNTPVAQRMEQTASNRKVEGSNPSGRTIPFINKFVRKIYHKEWSAAYYDLPMLHQRRLTDNINTSRARSFVNIQLREAFDPTLLRKKSNAS